MYRPNDRKKRRHDQNNSTHKSQLTGQIQECGRSYQSRKTIKQQYSTQEWLQVQPPPPPPPRNHSM